MRERGQVVVALEVVTRQQRRKPQSLGTIHRAGSCDQSVDGSDHRVEALAVPIEAGHAGRDQQAVIEELLEECLLVRTAGSKASHHTSLAMSSRLALVSWMRSFATINGADSASRRWRPTLKSVSFL